MARAPDDSIYHALPIMDEALANGGLEILRAGLIDDELFVTARHAFKDPAPWGQVLADITRRLAQIYSLETDFTEAEALAEIEEAYAADLGAKPVRKKPARAGKAAPRKAGAPGKTPAVKSKAAKAGKPKAAADMRAKRAVAGSRAAAPRKPAPKARGKR
ncbi:DUF5076 domain-containing protein [Rhodoplanes roseus]|uniref:DUF5076 domain-containing protein n=1 Tax=Rhodoplanes roseus TaxID=29409 RepID=A0A327L1R8_9BRAD|nr:DUF5076 domain-containing protein [Rhodoplanes roseus]RAI43422.1 hypothetical protein CH341_14340 [Rhodoplanes roseus]